MPSKNRQIFILLRHAEREDFQKNTFGDMTPLTTRGKDTAQMLGKKFSQVPIDAIYTSPLLRCVQTANEFIKGLGNKCPIHFSNILGDPGPFIRDPEKAGSVFLETPLPEILQAIAGGKRLPGMRSMEEGCKLFLDYTKKMNTRVSLMISHDSIISLLGAYFFKDKEVLNYIPGFLEGFRFESDAQYLKNITRFIDS
ncbi:MAG: Lipopolysaccharide core heptose(II)-phosphate phosphatase [Chlamydiae bacterium]|nr:Lipopolysaccharide core heptose(II)-phosphate phosphatase [Chlamydiota bacterium]